MTETDAWNGLAAWLGVILDRVRKRRRPMSGRMTEAAFVADAASFGAVQLYQVPEWGWGTTIERRPALDRLLIEIHSHSRGRVWEPELWALLFSFIPCPLPTKIAHDLIDREIGIQELGHGHQEEEIWWRLVDQVPEAVHNLALHRYQREEDDWSRVEEVINGFPGWETELYQLLVHSRASGTNKARQLAKRVRGVADSEGVMRPWKSVDPAFLTEWEKERTCAE